MQEIELTPSKEGINFNTKRRKFLQIHTFYQNYLNDFYIKQPSLINDSFRAKINALNYDGFSGIHMLAPYMHYVGYESELFIANDFISQLAWAKEVGIDKLPREDLKHFIAKAQIEYYKPDVLYLSDPIAFESSFIRSLNYRPKLILGWRAANTPKGTDWSEFDIILSNLSALREKATQLGAKKACHFWPGFPLWLYNEIKDVKSVNDIGFCGSWTTGQHKTRNEYITSIVNAFRNTNVSLNFHLSGEIDKMPKEVQEVNAGGAFGIQMLRNMKSAVMTFDARGSIALTNDNNDKDLAKKETGNMRIIEATGVGTLLITEAYDNLAELFIPGEEIVTYETKEDLIDKIKYYSENIAEAKAIAERGRLRCHREHSMAKRVVKLAEIIEDNYNQEENKNFVFKETSKQKEVMVDNDVLKLENTLTHAVNLLNQNKNQEVISLLENSEKYLNSFPTSSLVKSVALARSGNLDSAKSILIELKKIEPNNEQINSLLNEIESITN